MDVTLLFFITSVINYDSVEADKLTFHLCFGLCMWLSTTSCVICPGTVCLLVENSPYKFENEVNILTFADWSDDARLQSIRVVSLKSGYIFSPKDFTK